MLPVDNFEEAFEQPGLDLPGEPVPEKPAEEPFDPREYFLADNVKGAERLKWLEKRMNDRHDHDYYIIPYTGKHQYADFDEQANYEYFKAHYSWLNYDSEVLGFHRYAIEHPHPNVEDAQDFETYLAEIDDEEWDQFKNDVKEVRNGACLDDDRSSELRMAEEDEYFKDNYHDFIDALREQPWMHRSEYQWLLHAVDALEPDDVARLCQKHDHYPESEGQGSVYLNFEKAAKDVDPDEVIEELKGYKDWQQAAAQGEWETTKTNVWNEQRSTGFLFDKEMKEQLADRPELLEMYTNMDARESRAFFDQCLNDAAEFPKNNEYPRWMFIKAGYYDSPKVDRWLVMYPVDNWQSLDVAAKEDHIAASMFEFVRGYVIPALAGNAHKVPREHPELPFKEGIRVGRAPGDGDEAVERYQLPPTPPAQESLEASDDFDAKEYLASSPPATFEALKPFLEPFGFVDIQGAFSLVRGNESWVVTHADREGQAWLSHGTREQPGAPWSRVSDLRVPFEEILDYVQQVWKLLPKRTESADDFDAKDYLLTSPVEPDDKMRQVLMVKGFESQNEPGSIMPDYWTKQTERHVFVVFKEEGKWKYRATDINHPLPVKMVDGTYGVEIELSKMQESVEAAPVEEPFDAREYFIAEPIEIVDWLTVQGFKLTANDLWQWEDGHHQVTVQRSSYRNGDVWSIWDYDNVSGEEKRYRWSYEEDAVPFLRMLRQVKDRQPVQEAVVPPAEPVPPAPEPEFDPREYFTQPADSGKLVKETPTMRIIKPTTETVERFIETKKQGVNSPRVNQVYPMYMVIPKVGERFLIGIWEDGTLYTPPFSEKFTDAMLHKMEFSKELRRFFYTHAQRYLKDGDEHMAMRMLAQLYGSKAMLKYLDKYEVSDDLKLKLGIDAAKRGDAKIAAKLLNHPAELLTPEACSWYLKDWSDLSKFFESRYRRSAESILNGDSVEAHWIYEPANRPEVKDIVGSLDADDYETIREVLPHHTIACMEDDIPVMLTTELIKQFTDEDIAWWLGAGAEEVDPEGELEDIREALVNAACQAWETALTNDWFEGYKDTALSAIDAEAKWINGRLKITVLWEHVEAWLEEAEDRASDIDDLLYNYSPRAEPSDDYSKSSWDDSESAFDEALSYNLGELDMPSFPYEKGQLTMPDVLGPDPNEYVDITSYSQHSPHGYKSKLKRKEMERWQRDEPWRLDPEKWAAYAKEQNIEIPPKEEPKPTFNAGYYGVGESLVDVLLEKEYKYATTQLDVPPPQSDFIFEWGRLNIPDERLSFDDPDTNPRETEQHVTVLYGLTVNEVPEELRAITETFKPFPVYIGKISLFRQETQDVVKLDVESPWLRKLSGEIRAVIPNENKYPDYRPHLTIAYVKKGSCDDLDGVDIFANGQDTGVNPQFIAYGVVFKGAGDDQGNRVHDTLLFSRTKKARPVESEPFAEIPFPLDPEHVTQFLKATRSLAQRTIL